VSAMIHGRKKNVPPSYPRRCFDRCSAMQVLTLPHYDIYGTVNVRTKDVSRGLVQRVGGVVGKYEVR